MEFKKSQEEVKNLLENQKKKETLNSSESVKIIKLFHQPTITK